MGKQLGDDGRGREEVLEVIEDEQRGAVAQGGDDAVGKRRAGGVVDADRVGDRGQDEVGVPERCEGHEPDGAVEGRAERTP